MIVYHSCWQIGMYLDVVLIADHLIFVLPEGTRVNQSGVGGAR
jgi:hypothetical protein